ncbi:MAG TPA: universal stress protein [Rhizobiaceae bacterium]
MYRNVLVATDGSDIASSAVKHAASIAGAFDAQLTIVTVALLGPVVDSVLGSRTLSQTVFDEIRRATIDECAAILATASGAAGPDARTEMVESRDAYEGILTAANNIGADLIVMGSHSRSPLSRLILGSQASKVVGLSEVPVLIVK